MDKIVRAMNKTEEYTITAVTTTNVMKSVVANQNLVTGFSNAVSDIVSANALMSTSIKSDKEELSINLISTGMMSRVVSNVNNKGQINGYGVLNNESAASIIGEGVLEVVRFYDGKEISSSQIKIDSNKISDIITDYYYQSDQVYSVVLLASLVDKKTSEFYGSGGLLIQLLPDASAEIEASIIKAVSQISELSKKIALGLSAEEMIKLVDSEAIILDESDLSYHCNCTKEEIFDSVKNIDSNEIKTIIEEDGELTVICNACNTSYSFHQEDFE